MTEINPSELQFRFTANSDDPDDKSGRARWEIPVFDGCAWNAESFEADFGSFAEAHGWHAVLCKVLETGRHVGRLGCEARVLAALRPQH